MAAALVVAAAGLDLVHLARGRPRPWSVQRQVPRLWARIFPLPGATALYGLRLGIGPLTHLRSWLWWSGVAVAASTGAWRSAALGATFGAWRVLVQLAAVWRAEAAMPARMARVRGMERAVGRPVLVVTGALAAAAALTAAG